MAQSALIEHADLRGLSTFGLPAKADRLLVLRSPKDLQHPSLKESNLLILGQGSNTVFLSDWPGVIVVNCLTGRESVEMGDEVLLKVGAGESWHALVRYCLDKGWYGLENLVMIPGSVGAAPIQNIGAYGKELAERIESVTTWDRMEQTWTVWDRSQCQFGYRDSVFKHLPEGRHIITEVQFRLEKTFHPCTHYPSLAQALMDRYQTTDVTPRQLVATIMRLRRHRLPDPARLNNVGSFFKNPLVSASVAQKLIQSWPELPSWPIDQAMVKLSAAWMIEHVGLKGHRMGNVAVYPHHALVLVNLGHARAEELKALIREIEKKVEQTFGVRLMPEPRLVGAEQAKSD